MKYKVGCQSCLSLQGIKRIPPGRSIFESKYWTLEHKSQSPISGWVVLVLNTHKESLSALTTDEWYEFSIILPEIIRIIKNKFKSKKEYVCQFAEVKGFRHIHWHIIPIPKNFPEDYKGTKIFTILKKESLIKSDKEIIKLSKNLNKTFKNKMRKFIF